MGGAMYDLRSTCKFRRSAWLYRTACLLPLPYVLCWQTLSSGLLATLKMQTEPKRELLQAGARHLHLPKLLPHAGLGETALCALWAPGGIKAQALGQPGVLVGPEGGQEAGTNAKECEVQRHAGPVLHVHD